MTETPFRRAVAALAGVVVLAGCTPDLEQLVAWVHDQEQTAADAGYPCPIYADDLAWRGLPDVMLFVIDRESRCQPDAVNTASGDYGLTQIHASTWLGPLCDAGIACTRDELLDPGVNLNAAAFVYAVQGPSAWFATW